MHLLLVLADVYVGALAGAYVYGALRMLRRREAASLGSMRAHVVRLAFVNCGCLALSVAALVFGDVRVVLTALAVGVFLAAHRYLGWIGRHDDSEPGPPLTAADFERLHRAARATKHSALATGFSIVVLIPAVWFTLGWPWAVGLLAISVLGLNATTRTLPRAYRQSIERRGTEPTPRV